MKNSQDSLEKELEKLLEQHPTEWIVGHWEELEEELQLHKLFEVPDLIRWYPGKVFEIYHMLWENPNIRDSLCVNPLDFLAEVFWGRPFTDSGSARAYLKIFVDASLDFYGTHSAQDIAAEAFQGLLLMGDPLLLDVDFLEKVIGAIPDPLAVNPRCEDLADPDYIVYLSIINEKYDDPAFAVLEPIRTKFLQQVLDLIFKTWGKNPHRFQEAFAYQLIAFYAHRLNKGIIKGSIEEFANKIIALFFFLALNDEPD